jgi:hypothetical protein
MMIMLEKAHRAMERDPWSILSGTAGRENMYRKTNVEVGTERGDGLGGPNLPFFLSHINGCPHVPGKCQHAQRIVQ